MQSVDNKPTFLYVTLLRLHSRLLQGRIALLSMHCTLPSRKSCGCRFSALTEIGYQLDTASDGSVVSSKVGGYCAGGQLIIITSHVQSSPDPRCTESWTSFFAIKLRAPGSKLSCPCFPFCMLILISSCNLRKPSRFSCVTFWRSAACTPSQTPSEAEMTRPVPPLAKHLDLS